MAKIDLYSLTGEKKEKAIASIKKRRRIYHLLSLTVILAPVTMSLALICSNTIAAMKSNGQKTSGLITRLVHIICSCFFAILLVPICRHMSGVVGRIDLGE